MQPEGNKCRAAHFRQETGGGGEANTEKEWRVSAARHETLKTPKSISRLTSEPRARYQVAPPCNLASRCWHGLVTGFSRRRGRTVPSKSQELQMHTGSRVSIE